MKMAITKQTARSSTPEYRAYIDAKSRCTNVNSQRWYTHGGRGIKFLFNNFDEFFESVGKRPDGMTLDRIDNDGNYEPRNVRWATPSQQCSNRRSYKKKFRVRNEVAKTFIVTTPEGEKVSVFNMAEFCRQHGLTKSTLHQTIKGKYAHKGYRAEHA
jgi:hypothetical protein